MQGKFMQGVFWGGIVGAVIATNWERVAKKCPAIHEIKQFAKGKMNDNEEGCDSHSHPSEHKSKRKSRKYVQARSHRMLKD